MKSLLFSTIILGISAVSSHAAITFVIGDGLPSNHPNGIPDTPGGLVNNPERNIWPSGGDTPELPFNAIDGNLLNKHLNFGREYTGYIYTLPGDATATVTGIHFVSGNDSPPRDPTSYLLYGSNIAIASALSGTVYDVTLDFTLISSGGISLADGPRDGDNRTSDTVGFSNTAEYNTYLLVFPTVKGSGNSMQIGEARLQTADGPLDNSGIIGGGQMVIPEPGAASLLALMGLGFLARRHRTA